MKKNKWKSTLKRIILEPLRFLLINIIVFLSYKLFMLPIVGGTFKCGGTFKANTKCGDEICSDGSCPLTNGLCSDGSKPFFNVGGFWDGFCISKIQGCILIVLLFLLLLPFVIATMKHTISKLWTIYALFPVAILTYLIIAIMR